MGWAGMDQAGQNGPHLDWLGSGWDCLRLTGLTGSVRAGCLDQIGSARLNLPRLGVALLGLVGLGLARLG